MTSALAPGLASGYRARGGGMAVGMGVGGEGLTSASWPSLCFSGPVMQMNLGWKFVRSYKYRWRH